MNPQTLTTIMDICLGALLMAVAFFGSEFRWRYWSERGLEIRPKWAVQLTCGLIGAMFFIMGVLGPA